MLLRVAVLVLLAALAGTPSAAAAPLAEGGPAVSPRSEACAGGPCPVLVFAKGGGSGVIQTSPMVTTPQGVRCRPPCDFTVEDVETVSVWAVPDPGSALGNPPWERCPRLEDDGSCVLPAGTGFGFTICAVFVRSGGPATPPPGCPPGGGSSPPPPPPPPSGPPPLGSRCTIPGSAQADVMRGTAGRDVICGGGGNDRILGGSGHDLILGGAGKDKLYGQGGRDRILAGSGADLLDGGGSDDWLLGGSSADVFFARDRVRDSLNGGAARDRARVDPVDRLSAIERRF